MAAYPRRLTRRRSPLSAEFLCVLVVVATGAATAWWAGHHTSMNLSAIVTVADVLGMHQTVGTTRQVGYTQDRAQQSDVSASPYCQPGQTPAFENGMAALHHQVGTVMGVPVECEHAATAAGDTVQETSTGLAAYNSQTNTDTFTDGWHHWALTQNGLVSWEGTDSIPPQQAEAPQPDQADSAATSPN